MKLWQKCNYYIISFYVIINLNLIICERNLRNKYENLVKLSNLHEILGVGINFQSNSGKNTNTGLKSKSYPIEYDNELCDLQFNYFVDSLMNTETWAINLIDAWGKLPSGIMSGHMVELGNFDQCLNMDHKSTNNTIGTIKGQYCLASFTIDTDVLPLSSLNGKAMMPGTGSSGGMNIKVGACIPDTCEPSYLQQQWDVLFDSLNITMPLITSLETCQRNKAVNFDAKDIFMIILLSIVLLLWILSTTYDVITIRLKKPQRQGLLAFSIFTNGKKIFSLKKSKSPDVMNCLNGIRVLSLGWVILSHGYLMMMVVVLINTIYVTEWVTKYHSMLTLSATVSVDSFFLLSGLLVTWSVFKELDKRGRLNIPMMYFHRYLRLTPALAILILFTVSLFRYMGTGPYAPVGQVVGETSCRDNWWAALLYIQNYYNPTAICLGHSWYLSVDMQLFIVSPIILIPLWKWGRKFVGVIFLLILVGIAAAFGIFYANDMHLKILDGAMAGDYMKLLYYPIHIRMSAWLVGVLLGYLLFNLKNKEVKLPKYVVAAGWIFSLGILLAVIFGQYNIQQIDYEENLIESTSYIAFTRTAWVVALAWIIFACVNGYGGYINSFLSLSFWLPLARLSYSMYLIHFMFQIIRVKRTRTSDYFDDWNVLFYFFVDFCSSFFLSLFWTLAFESPILTIEKLIFSKSQEKEKQPTESLEVLTHIGGPDANQNGYLK